jgi:hypothetical protein
MRYVSMIVAVEDDSDIEDNLDEAAETLQPGATLVEWDISDKANETWVFGGDRIEDSVKVHIS